MLQGRQPDGHRQGLHDIGQVVSRDIPSLQHATWRVRRGPSRARCIPMHLASANPAKGRSTAHRFAGFPSVHPLHARLLPASKERAREGHPAGNRRTGYGQTAPDRHTQRTGGLTGYLLYNRSITPLIPFGTSSGPFLKTLKDDIYGLPDIRRIPAGMQVHRRKG